MTIKEFLKEKGISKVYHFTDRDNLQSIVDNGGLLSWMDCDDKNIVIPKPGGGDLSRALDRRQGLQYYVRTSFVKDHPMKHIAMNDGRISNPVLLEIDIEKLLDTTDEILFSNCNAAASYCKWGGTLDDLQSIKFDLFSRSYFDLDSDERHYYQAEVLVKNKIPLACISNIEDFITVPLSVVTSQPAASVRVRAPYTQRITRDHPTAFIFLIDHSCSMNGMTDFHGQKSMAEASSEILNKLLFELCQRCVKGNELYRYIDFAVIGYGHETYSGWQGNLAGRDFVTPQELWDNPISKKPVTIQKKTPKGIKETTMDIPVWFEARSDGYWTRLHKALRKAKDMAEQWMNEPEHKDCYPPTIINITDGEYNGCSDDDMQEIANDVKSLETQDGNAIFMNIHIARNASFDDQQVFPRNENEVTSSIGKKLLKLSSLMPSVYNKDICGMKALDFDDNSNIRYYGMGVNLSMEQLARMLKIGTTQTTSMGVSDDK